VNRLHIHQVMVEARWPNELPYCRQRDPEEAIVTNRAPASTASYPAHFEADTVAVIVDHLAIRERDVVHEAHQWTRGERGPVVDDPDELVRADLTNYVTAVLRTGACALSVTGRAQESRALFQSDVDGMSILPMVEPTPPKGPIVPLPYAGRRCSPGARLSGEWR